MISERIDATTEYEEADLTLEAQKILCCIEFTGERYGKAMICDLIRGVCSEKIEDRGLDRHPTCGLLRGYTEERVLGIIGLLHQYGYIGQEGTALRWTKKSKDIVHEGEVFVVLIPKKLDPQYVQRIQRDSRRPFDPILFAKLKKH